MNCEMTFGLGILFIVGTCIILASQASLRFHVKELLAELREGK